MRLGVDVGGTFTDAVLAVPDGTLHRAKAPTTPGDESAGVLEAITAVLSAAGAGPAAVQALAHGTTTTTNALLEGRAARTALLATAGFTDVVELRRQDRPDLYRLCVAPPAALVAPELRFAVDERCGPHGPIRAPTGLGALTDRLADLELDAVAVVLLHAAAHPAHERAVGDALAAALPGVHVSLSHEVSATPREYERAATTELDAALSPLLRAHLDGLAARCRALGLPEPAVMLSSGGLASAAAAAAHGAFTVLSGPAGGAQGARLLADGADALCFDMGGTSCDVCVIDGGVVRETAQRTIAGRPLALPSLDIETVGAGGGSIGWADSGGALRVGPRSAGARPGPAAYGRGGREPTVTDAHVVLGHFPREGRIAGGLVLDQNAALAAVSGLADQLGIEPRRAAEGIIAVADAEMLGALRTMTIARGVDPRGHTLLPFGGAGPLHATAIAERLGVQRILCPAACGVLSALGLAAAAPRRDASGSFESADVARLLARARAELDLEPAATRIRYALRYRGQSFELDVDAGPEADSDELRARFERAHEREFGFHDPAGSVELVTVTASVWGPAPRLAPRAAGGGGRRSRQPIWHDGQALEAVVIAGEPAAGERIDGPAICALPEATLLITPGWQGRAGADGTIELRRR
jgi:N-methylhydantoinase A